MKEDVIGVALVHELCNICGKETNEHILMNSWLTPRNAKEVKALHKKALGFSDEPCDECKELKKKGFIFIGVDLSKTDDKSNPYRTGNLWVIKMEAAIRLGVDTKMGAAFIDIIEAERIGLNNFNETV